MKTTNFYNIYKWLVSTYKSHDLFSSFTGLALTFSKSPLLLLSKLSLNSNKTLIVYNTRIAVLIYSLSAGLVCPFFTRFLKAIEKNSRLQISNILLKFSSSLNAGSIKKKKTTKLTIDGMRYFYGYLSTSGYVWIEVTLEILCLDIASLKWNIDSIEKKILLVVRFAISMRSWFALNLKKFYTSYDFSKPLNGKSYREDYFYWLGRITIGFKKHALYNEEDGSESQVVVPKERIYAALGDPRSQYLYSFQFFDTKHGIIGKIVSVVNQELRIVKVMVKYGVDLNSVGISILLVIPVKRLVRDGNFFGGIGVSKKLLSIPLTRVSAIVLIDGGYFFNAIVPRSAHFYTMEQIPGKSFGAMRAHLCHQNKCFLDLQLLISSVGFNVFKRRHAFFNLISRPDSFAKAIDQYIAKLDTYLENTKQGLIAQDDKARPFFEKRDRKEDEARKQPSNKKSMGLDLIKNPLTGPLSQELLTILLKLKWWLLCVTIVDNTGKSISMLFRSLGTRLLGNYIIKGLNTHSKGCLVQITDIMVIDPNLVEKYTAEGVVGKLYVMLESDIGKRVVDQKQIFAFIYNRSKPTTSGMLIYERSKEGLISLTKEQIAQISDLLGLQGIN